MAKLLLVRLAPAGRTIFWSDNGRGNQEFLNPEYREDIHPRFISPSRYTGKTENNKDQELLAVNLSMLEITLPDGVPPYFMPCLLWDPAEIKSGEEGLRIAESLHLVAAFATKAAPPDDYRIIPLANGARFRPSPEALNNGSKRGVIERTFVAFWNDLSSSSEDDGKIIEIN